MFGVDFVLSLRLKIILSFTVTVVAAFTYFVHSINNDLKPSMRKALEEVLVEQAHTLSALIESSAPKDSPLSAKLLVKAWNEKKHHKINAEIYDFLKTELDLRVYLTDEKGLVIFHSEEPSLIGTDFSSWNDVHRTLRGEYGARTTRDNENDPGSSVLFVAAPVLGEAGEVRGVVSVGKPALHNNNFVALARKDFTIFGILVILSGLVLSWLLTLWLSHPLSVLRQYILDLRSGKNPEFPELGNNEVAELGKALFDLKTALEGKEYVHHFVQSLSHELKSPLSSIIGASELLKEHGLVRESGLRFLDNITSESKRMEALLRNLVSLSNLELAPVTNLESDFDAAEFFEECQVRCKVRLGQKELRFVTSVPEGLAYRGDRSLLLHALMNLIENAIDFSPRSAAIELTGFQRMEGRKVIQGFTVRDEGPGIEPWAQERIFERFFSLPRPDSKKKSSGVGLAITEVISGLHGGGCVVRESSPRGAEFEFWW